MPDRDDNAKQPPGEPTIDQERTLANQSQRQSGDGPTPGVNTTSPVTSPGASSQRPAPVASAERPLPAAELGQTQPHDGNAASLDSASVQLGQSSANTRLGPDQAAEPKSQRPRQHSGVSDIKPDMHISRYRLIRRIGAGTYGIVYEAVHEFNDRRVAFKFFREDRHLDYEELEREVLVIRRLRETRGIVHIEDVDLEHDPPYYVMEYCQGGSLSDRLEQTKKLPVAEALRYFREIVETLAYVHARGIRHCDLKPQNILIDGSGRLRLADFGQARLCDEANLAFGTWFFMPPEQANTLADVPDASWDVYAVGVIFYRMLTGELPRFDSAFRERLSQSGVSLHRRLREYRELLAAAPAPELHHQLPEVDRDLREIVDRCLSLDPKVRFRDGGSVLAALERREWRRRQRRFLWVTRVSPIVLTLLLAVLGWFASSAALNDVSQSMAERLLASNEMLARSVAASLQIEMDRRVGAVLRVAADPKIREAIVAQDRPRLKQLLKKSEEQARSFDGEQGQQKSWFYGMNVADAHGTLLAMTQGDVLDQQVFDWRDWFSGQGDLYAYSDLKTRPPGMRFPPITRVHISQPYVSRVSKRPLIVAISAPVWSGDKPGEGSVVGVVMGAMEIDQLQGLLRGNVRRPQDLAPEPGKARQQADLTDGFVVLLNERGQFLVHRNMDQIKPEYSAPPLSVTDDSDRANEVYRAILAQKQGNRLYQLHDPVTDHTYYAAYMPLEMQLPDTDGQSTRTLRWVVIVQHDTDSVQKPIGQLRWLVIRFALGAVAVAAGFTAVLWVWLDRRQRKLDLIGRS